MRITEKPMRPKRDGERSPITEDNVVAHTSYPSCQATDLGGGGQGSGVQGHRLLRSELFEFLYIYKENEPRAGGMAQR